MLGEREGGRKRERKGDGEMERREREEEERKISRLFSSRLLSDRSLIPKEDWVGISQPDFSNMQFGGESCSMLGEHCIRNIDA